MTGAVWITLCFAACSTMATVVFLHASNKAYVAAGKDPDIGNRLVASEINATGRTTLAYTIALWAAFVALVVTREVLG